MSDKKRLDIALFEQGFAESREKAKALIMSGIVYVNDQKEIKAGRDIKTGDIIQIATDKDNKVLKYELVYQQGESSLVGGRYQIGGDDSESSAFYAALATPYRFRTSVLDVLPAEISADTALESDLKPRYMPFLGNTAIKYDKETGKVVEISTNEIKDYVSFGNSCDKIVYYMVYEGIHAIFVIG